MAGNDSDSPVTGSFMSRSIGTVACSLKGMVSETVMVEYVGTL